MKAILALLTIVAFLTLEWAAAPSDVFLLSLIPAASLAALWWLDRLPPVSRAAFAAASGFLFDVAGAHPFGASMILFLFLAASVGFLHKIFSAHDSRAARGVSMAVMVALFFVLRPAAAAVAGFLP